MNEHTLTLLSFGAVIEELKSYCSGEEARRLLETQGFYTQRREAEQALKPAVELRRLLDAGRNPPQLSLPDVGAFVFRLKKKGTLLDPQELAALAVFIGSSIGLKRFLTGEAPPPLKEIAREIPELDDLRRGIARVIDPEGNILDKKVPALAAIKARIKRIHAGIENLSRSYLHAEGNDRIWQSDLPTIKDGRTVLALKAQFKGRVKGIVHEVSGSGATIYIEPQEIVEQNNLLVIEENNYKQEVVKLIRALSDQVRERLHDIGVMLEKTAFLDALLAKARYARAHDCACAGIAEDRLELYEARHPLLGKSAVPITVTMDETCRVLIITGPNTGGKTVSLKTVGLLALMHQFGLEIPAREGSVLPVFDLVTADIGDEQSIEQSLSTFSSHMTTIAGITESATRRSLVLLDELGAGTDPEEGTAIAMAILDFLIGKGCRVIATTHHGILKNYGYTQSGVTNASVDFDPLSLIPTYKLIMGIPGESHALVIAARNGLGADIITRAKGYLNDERTDISRLIGELSRRQKDLFQLQEQQQQKQRIIEEKLKETERREQDLRRQEDELRERGLRELNELLSAGRKELERVIKEIRERRDVQENIEKGRQVIGALEEGVARESGRLTEASRRPRSGRERSGRPGSGEPDPGRSAEIGPGMTVVIAESGKRGTVVRRARGGGWVVDTDTARITLPAHELEPDEPRGPERVSVSISAAGADTLPVFELNVRGFRLAPAMRSVEKQLDAAVVRGVGSFTILHGKGHGILQQAIHEYLKNNPNVREYHFARPEEGGSGKTVVIMKT
jgi:DNA mismatch repair protein MutS2